MYWNRENRREIRNLWSMTKKRRSSEISADENQEIFQEKVKFRKFSSESEDFPKIGGNLKQGGNASWSQRGWTPLAAAICVIN